MSNPYQFCELFFGENVCHHFLNYNFHCAIDRVLRKMGHAGLKIAKFSICLLTVAAAISGTSAAVFNIDPHLEQTDYSVFGFNVPMMYPKITRSIVNDGLIIQGRDDIFEDLYKLYCCCFRFVDMVQKYESQFLQRENSFYSGSSAKIVQDVHLDITFNLCQNMMDISAAYHQALINEHKSMPWFYKGPQAITVEEPKELNMKN